MLGSFELDMRRTLYRKLMDHGGLAMWVSGLGGTSKP